MYVLIIGGRYGSNASGEAGTTKGFYEVYDSVTRQEYLVASQRGIPTYALVDQSVYADYENFTKNRDNSSFTYAHVDSVNVFRLLEHILRQRLNNPVFPFTRFSDIEAVLREQWSGHFRDLLARASSQRQLHSLNDQVNHLSEISANI